MEALGHCLVLLYAVAGKLTVLSKEVVQLNARARRRGCGIHLQYSAALEYNYGSSGPAPLCPVTHKSQGTFCLGRMHDSYGLILFPAPQYQQEERKKAKNLLRELSRIVSILGGRSI